MKPQQALGSIWNEFVYGGHLLSLGFSGVVLLTIILLDVKIEWQILGVAYLVAQIIYSYNHFEEAEKDLESNPERSEHLQKIVKYFPLLILVYFLVLIFLLVYFFNINFFLFTIFFLAIGILYTKFFKGLTKKITGFKNLYVAFAWAFGGVFLPLFYYSFSFNLLLFFTFLFIFFRWVINTAFFDLKDIESDKKEKLLTLPVQLGERKTLQFLHILNFVSFSPLFLGISLELIPVYSLGLIIFYFYSFYYLQKATKIEKKDLRQLSYVIVDGEYILWPLSIFLIKYLI